MLQIGTKTRPCTSEGWILRYFAQFDTLLLLFLAVHDLCALMQMSEELVWELFVQAGPVGRNTHDLRSRPQCSGQSVDSLVPAQ